MTNDWKIQSRKNCFHDDGKIHREKIAWMMIEKYIKQKKMHSTKTK